MTQNDWILPRTQHKQEICASAALFIMKLFEQILIKIDILVCDVVYKVHPDVHFINYTVNNKSECKVQEISHYI
jgi:hypothetical protein